MNINKTITQLFVVVSIGILVLMLFVGGCKKGGGDVQSFYIELAEQTLSVSDVNSMEDMEFFLLGDGVENIILDTIQLKGDNPSSAPLDAVSAERMGNRVLARFPKSGAIQLLSDPAPNSMHTFNILFFVIEKDQQMSTAVSIKISSDSENGVPVSGLSLELDPDLWNLNYSQSAGTVEAFIRGEDIENIDLTSFEIMGDNPAATAVPADSASLSGDHIHARFAKNQLIDLLLTPADNTVHTVTVSFRQSSGGERLELMAQITIEGDAAVTVDPTDLSLELDPVEWSLNFTNSSGTVEAFIRGDGIENIDLTSFEMMGDNPSATAVPAVSASLSGDHIHARFAKNQLIDLLLNPAPGTFHTIIVGFTAVGSDERLELTASITIEEDPTVTVDPTDLSLELDPDEWSLNFTKSSGTVEAFIRGDGIENIDLTSFEMMGDNPAATAVPAASASLTGDHVHARFAKNQLIDLLLNPASGTVHTITVSFTTVGGGERIELTTQITIEEEDPVVTGDPANLTLEIDPSTWNMNYATSSGSIKAFIRGDGLDGIDLDSIEMYGDNSASLPLPSDSASLQGEHVKASFPKNQLLGLLLNPASGTTHTVTVKFLGTNGNLYELTDQVSITGK